MKNKSIFKLKLVFWLIPVALLIAVLKAFNVQEILKSSLDWIRGLGPLGMGVFVLIYVTRISKKALELKVS